MGFDFNLGFCPHPGNLIRNVVYNAPCLTTCGGGGPCEYVTINSQNFDSGWGIWTDGGTDCARINNSAYANSGTYSIQLRDNTSTSVMTTTNQNWTAYEEITVSFSFISVSFDNSNEDLWVQLSNNGGSSYTTKADYNHGVHFTNGVRVNTSVVIAGPFASNSRLRFRADASADDDQVYIDDDEITGCPLHRMTPMKFVLKIRRQQLPPISTLCKSARTRPGMCSMSGIPSTPTPRYTSNFPILRVKPFGSRNTRSVPANKSYGYI